MICSILVNFRLHHTESFHNLQYYCESFVAFTVKLIVFHCFRLKTSSYGGKTKVVVNCELDANRNNLTSLEHSVQLLSFPLTLQQKQFCWERFMLSTCAFDYGAFGTCLSFMLSLFINSVPLSVTRVSDKPSFYTQCS